MYQLQNAEELAGIDEEYEEPISRWLNGDLRPEDHDVMIEMIDSTLPDNQIMWPPWVMINVENGHITLTAHVLDIVVQA